MYRPVLRALVGAQGTNVGTPLGLEVIQYENAFDAAVLTVPRFQASPIAYAKGTPVQFTWGRTPSSTALFTGYVDHLETYSSQRRSLARVVCLGAGSQPLRDAASRQWPVGSAADVAVQQIADHLHLSSLTEPAPVPAPGGPVNESWWAFIRRCARAAGFVAYVVGTDLRFHSRRIDTSGTGIPYFLAHNDVRVRIDNTVFRYDTSDADDDGVYVHRQRRAQGVSDEGLLVSYTDVGDLESVGGVSQDMPTLTRNENIVVHDVGDASTRLGALQENNRFVKRSKFTVSGNETVRQAATVIFRGMNVELDGYWYVMKAVHRVTTSSYETELVAGRDGVGDSAPVNLAATAPVIGLGVGEPVQAPASMLMKPVNGVSDLVFPTSGATWTASSLLHRKHYPWRAAVRG
jgi:phage protein D